MIETANTMKIADNVKCNYIKIADRYMEKNIHTTYSRKQSLFQSHTIDKK